MGKKTVLAALAAALLLALTLPLSAAAPSAASLTLDGPLRPGASVTATLRLTGESISGVSFRLQSSDGVTVNACYLLSPGWSLDGTGGRYAAHSASAPVQTLDIAVSLTVEGMAPGEAAGLTVDQLTLSDGRADTALPALSWQSVFLPPRGDLNGDNVADIRDAQCLYDYLCLGSLPAAFAGDEAAFRTCTDLDGNGGADILDYQLLCRLLWG
jgi:hypothetical protein